MQELDGIGFCPCEADCSWLHRQWWHGRMTWQEVATAATDPQRANSFAVTHCAAAAVLPEAFPLRADQFSARDLLTRHLQVTWECPACHHVTTETVTQLATHQPRGYTLADVDHGDLCTVSCDKCRAADSAPEDQLLVALARHPEIGERISRRRLPGSGHRPDAVIDLPTGVLVVEYDGHRGNHDTRTVTRTDGTTGKDWSKVRKDERITQRMIELDHARVVRFRMPRMPLLRLDHHHDQLLQFTVATETTPDKQPLAGLIHALVSAELAGDTTIWTDLHKVTAWIHP